MATAVSRLEQILLKPQATEASYTYIESLVSGRIQNKTVFDETAVDDMAEIIDLLECCLRRAGSGWVMVVASRLSRDVVCGILSQLTVVGSREEDVIGALSRLVDANPVLVLCNHETIVNHLVRLLKSSTVSSPSLLRLVASVLSVRLPVNSILHVVAARALSLLVIARNSAQVTSCLSLLVLMTDFIGCDLQLTNTYVGLLGVAEAAFGFDAEVRRLCRMLRGLVRTEPELTQDEQPHESSRMVVDPVAEKSELVVVLPTLAVEPMRVEAAEFPEDGSPRSSCPSLDF